MGDTQRVTPTPAGRLAGIRFRSPHGAADAGALYAVHLGRMAHDAIDPASASESFPSRERLAESLSKAAAENRLDHWLVAQASEQVVGYSQVVSWPEGDGTWVYLSLGWVLPAWRNQGIGTTMLHWAE